MDKYEYKLKLDQLKSLVAKADYETAAEIANSINWKKVRNSNTLCMVGDIYEQVGKYEESKAVLLQAYDHSSIGRNIVAKLADIALKTQNIEEAEEYYNEFVEIAPRDNLRYVIGYKLSCLKDAPLTDRIAILEDFKEKEYTEIWAYELAVLYSKADMRDKCVTTCDELILWFGDGEYVEKALDLKRRYQPLTPSQEEKYQRFRERQGMVEISIPSKDDPSGTEKKVIPEVTITASKFNTVNLQEELARSMQQIMDATESGEVAESMDNIKKIVTDIPYLRVDEEQHEARQKQINAEIDDTLMKDFKTRMTSEMPDLSAMKNDQIEGQMSIEDVLSEWEKMKVAAEAAMQTAEQKKLEMAKESALAEASEIMERLKALIPIISAQEDEIPEDNDTIADNLKREIRPNVIIAQPITEEAPAQEEDDDIKIAEKPEEGSDAVEPELIAEIQAGMSKEISEMTQEEEPVKEELKEELQATVAVQLPIEQESTLTEALAQEVAAVIKEEQDQAAEKSTEEEDEDALLTAGLAESIGAMMREAKAPVEEPVEEQTAQDDEDELLALSDILASALAEDIPAVEEPVEEAIEEEVIEAAAEEVEETTEEMEVPAEETADDDIEMPNLEAMLAEAMAEDPVSEEAPAEEAEIVEAPVEETAEENEEALDEIQAELESLIAQEIASAMDEEEAPAEETAKEAEAEETPEAAEEEAEPAGRVSRRSKFEMPDNLDDEFEEEAPAAPGLTPEQRKSFSYFLPVPGMEKAITKVVLSASDMNGLKAETSYAGNMVITGNPGSGKTVLATNLIKTIQPLVGREDKRIGKIKAESMNKRDLTSLIPKMDGGYLIIENAGSLTKEKAISMSLAMGHDTKGMTLILEDTKEAIDSLLASDVGFAQKFTERIDIPAFTIDELINFAKVYANEMECEIDEMAVLALYNKLNNINRIDHEITLVEVKDILDRAIDNAEGGGVKKLFAKKYTDNDFLILREEDFEI